MLVGEARDLRGNNQHVPINVDIMLDILKQYQSSVYEVLSVEHSYSEVIKSQ
jgi:hypothetical protein